MKRISIMRNLVRNETDRAFLIAMPHASSYDGFLFWFPKSLTCYGRSDHVMTLLIPDGFEFRLRKTDRKGKLMDEDTIGADGMMSEFEGRQARDTRDAYVPPHVPEAIDPVKAVVPEELKDD